MTLPPVSRIAVLAALVLIASSASAQSLGSVARQEEARRAAVQAAAKAKVLTNADLAADPNAATAAAPVSLAAAVPAPTPAPADAAAAAASSATDSAAATPAAAPAPGAKPKEDEALWRRRAAEHRDRLEKAQARVDSFTGVPKTDAREQARTDALVKQVQDELRRADEAQRLFVMQADVAGIPMAWIK